MNRRAAAELFLILLAAIALFTAWMMKLAPGLVVVWAVAATLATVLVVAVMIVRGRR